ncbi:DNA replication/repair protein RecF [Acholeplasma hippikon]|uniref:DNA replication and repair protein RecF n=1 Tax=Acholeplasma hippikon TaxID=264636 RepID=A0A449BKS9_9MOLU|nr:DNA replication and repair protein RecF [Acholeplasma hippikon]VEU83032.1 DNA replication and repair protein recF [Acholeplasma hippikon]
MIEKIELRNFRNLNNYQIKVEKPLVLLEGSNGVGKTSILESIYFAATTKSHRTSQEKELIQYDKMFAAVKIKDGANLFEIILSENGKRTFINKSEVKKISDYIGKMHAVMFSPEDLNLIKGGPSERRYFMDLELSQVSKEYLRLMNHYKKILKQRNALLKTLKDSNDYTFLNILGEQLLETGYKIYDFRERFILNLNEKIQAVETKYKNFKVALEYDPNVTKEQWAKHMKTKQKTDIMYEQTTVGIHKDDFKVVFNGFNAKDFASQGTTRLIVIELKLALLQWIKEETNEHAVLLLDDVLSELDIERQNLFLEKLPTNHQVFISSAVPLYKNFDLQRIVLSKEIG